MKKLYELASDYCGKELEFDSDAHIYIINFLSYVWKNKNKEIDVRD